MVQYFFLVAFALMTTMCLELWITIRYSRFELKIFKPFKIFSYQSWGFVFYECFSIWQVKSSLYASICWFCVSIMKNRLGKMVPPGCRWDFTLLESDCHSWPNMLTFSNILTMSCAIILPDPSISNKPYYSKEDYL